MGRLISNRFGQSIVEYVVLLALVAVIVFTVVAGIGQRTRNRVAQANEALEEQAVAAATAARPAAAGISHRGGGNSDNGNHSGWGQGEGGGHDHPH
jgi:Flp pilus assembly pilin Flp